MLPFRLCAFLVLGLSPAVHAALDITDRFHILLDETTDKDQKKANGNCGWLGKANFNAIWNECFTLAETGIKLVDDFHSKPEASRLLNAFFKNGDDPLTDNNLALIRGTFEAVRDWVEKGGRYNYGESVEKPYLYCFHTWLEKKTMQDLAWDTEGRNLMEENPAGDGFVATIEDVADYREAQKNQEEQLREAGVKNPKVVPYWVKQQGVYIFDQYYGKDKGYCTSTGSGAATQHVTPASTITLCPTSLGTTNGALSNKRVVKLRSPGLTPKRRDATQVGDQQLNKLYPTSITLFHELFHLVLGNEETVPDGGEVYDLDEMLKLDWDKASQNPETYANVAVAYDYTIHSGEKNGWKVEFYTGYTTQG
ncbi:hypothetical protein B0I35DRAFT_484990 [Stachybotrys elegans]|uniref:Lysine-specific metallo-endopeptidase domain-containing protein n=1 Tax=Stachybotrys elegans TaxID=80388 RepID=A0A8K0WK43_9HYPO|nr:hypothetical protein B0I35DRAFT_484990 [Stachybotrys elegans]